MKPTRWMPLLMLALAACGEPVSQVDNSQKESTPTVAAHEPAANKAATRNEAIEAPLNPPAPGQPGALADDRTPVSETPFTRQSAQGAANVVQTYFALVEAGKYGEARRLWSGGGDASGLGEDAFARSFAGYREYHGLVGAPGTIEGAAGSLYIEVPVQLYGRLRSGKEYSVTGPVLLRRVNNVPGSTPEQRQWRITAIKAAPPQ